VSASFVARLLEARLIKSGGLTIRSPLANVKNPIALVYETFDEALENDTRPRQRLRNGPRQGRRYAPRWTQVHLKTCRDARRSEE
jgi:hypothetical protein